MFRQFYHVYLTVFTGITLLFSNLAHAQPSDDLYVLRLKTGVVTQVTSSSGSGEFNPSFSPNSKKIVHDVLGVTHDLYITDLKTGVSTPLTGGEGGNDAAWSPLGGSIAFDRIPATDPSIYIVPSGGGTPGLVVGDAVDPDWAPLGDWLVFHRPSNGGIYTVDLLGGPVQYVADGINPVWSPNGQWIAYSYNNNIWKRQVNSSGIPVGSPMAVTFDLSGFDYSQPTWSNNSKTIIFHSNRGGADHELWSVKASGGTPTLVFGFLGTGGYGPAYSNNGKLVAFAGSGGTPVVGPVADNKDSNAGLIESQSLPKETALLKNYPNPFNPETEIHFQLSADNRVIIKVYNSLGQEIRTLTDASYVGGTHTVRWNGKDNFGNSVPSGVYFYHMNTGSFNQVRKMMLVK